MNQNQRKFLLETIQKQFKTERSTLHAREPKAPSLNNYLIASVLDGSFQLKDAETIRSTISRRVRDLGKDQALVSDSRRHYGHSVSDTEDKISLPAIDLFELPPAYAEALKAYEAAKAAWDAEMKALEDSLRAIELKINIGSDKALAALIDQADQLCSLSLVKANSLFLTKT